MFLTMLQKIEKYLSINLEVLLYIKIILKIILNLSKSFHLIPQAFYFWKIKFLFFRPCGIFISRLSCLLVLLIVVVRVSRRGKAHMRFSISRLKRIAYCRVCFTIKAEKNISWFIVENKEDLLIYLRLKSLIFHNFFTFTAKLIKKNML
jgi:hypothetical protein